MLPQKLNVIKDMCMLDALRRANIARQAEWCPEKPDLAFRGNEMAGEIGETIEAMADLIVELAKASGRVNNTIKKLERARHGWKGKTATVEQLADEICDSFITLDLVALTAGIDVKSRLPYKFNGTSISNDLATRIGLDPVYSLDTDKVVCFYEQDFYVLSNFSSFQMLWKGELYPTSEHAYHSEKFIPATYKAEIRAAKSADDAYRISYKYKEAWRTNWLNMRVAMMREILVEKIKQHYYVKKKLLDTGDRTLIENSWRDDFWGWGRDHKGQNRLGKLWMEIRDEVRRFPELFISADEDNFKEL